MQEYTLCEMLVYHKAPYTHSQTTLQEANPATVLECGRDIENLLCLIAVYRFASVNVKMKSTLLFFFFCFFLSTLFIKWLL